MKVEQVGDRYEEIMEAWLDEEEGHEALLDKLLRDVVCETLRAVECEDVEYLADDLAEFPRDVIEAIYALVTAEDFFDVLVDAA